MSSSPDAPIVQWVSKNMKSIMLATNVAALLEALLYGIHFVLFCICMYILNRCRGSMHWFVFASAFVMFAISTADISITFRLMGHDIQLLYGSDLPAALAYLLQRFFPKNLLFVGNNFVAELILLYRCYMVWGHSKYLVIAASFLVLADTVWGFLGMSQSLLTPQSKFVPVFMWSIFGLNIAISGITAGRIFWVARGARPILGDGSVRRYRTAIAVLIESSAVYSTCLVCYLVFPARSSYQVKIVAMSICMRVVAIMPTLLIVQVGLDRIVTDFNTRECERPIASVALDAIVTTKHLNEISNSGCCDGHADSDEGRVSRSLGGIV